MPVNFNILHQGRQQVQPGGMDFGTLIGAMNAKTAQANLLRKDQDRTAVSNILTGAGDTSQEGKFNFDLAATRLARAGFIDEAKKLTDIRAGIPSARTAEEQLAIIKDAYGVLPSMARLAAKDPTVAASFMPAFQTIFGKDFTGTPEQLANLSEADLKPVAERLQIVDRGGDKIVVDPANLEDGQTFETTPTATSRLNAQVRRENRGDRSRFGNSARGLAMDTLITLRAKERAGQRLTPEEQDMRAAAVAEMQRPELRLGPAGEVIQVTPGMPAGLDESAIPTADDALQEAIGGAPSSGAGAVPATTPPTPPTQAQPSRSGTGPDGGPARTADGTTVTTLTDPRMTESTRQLIRARDGVHRTIESILDVVDEAKKSGENILGIEGAVRASKLGQMSRQLGSDVSPRSSQLSGLLEILRGQLARPVLGEARLAEPERKRLEKIVRNLESGIVDDEMLESTITEVIKFIGNPGNFEVPDEDME